MVLDRWTIILSALAAAVSVRIFGGIMLYANPPAPNMFALVPVGFFKLWVFPVVAAAIVVYGAYAIRTYQGRKVLIKTIGILMVLGGVALAVGTMTGTWGQPHEWMVIGAYVVSAVLMAYFGSYLLLCASLIASHDFKKWFT